jgi:hypothetical protein
MIILKILLIMIFTYFLAKGITRELENKVFNAEKSLLDYKNLAKEHFQKLQAEKTILTTTIKELREELSQLKGE